MVFSKNGESKIEQLHYNGISIWPKTSCCYLGIMIDNNLNFDIQLNKTLAKMANSIRSIYLVRHHLPLKARIRLFKSLVLSHLNFVPFWRFATCAKSFTVQEIFYWKTKFYQQSFSLKKFDFLNFLTSHDIKRAVEKPKIPQSGFLKKRIEQKLQNCSVFSKE